MAAEATFRLLNARVDPTGVLSAIKVPRSDVLAACALEQICIGLRRHSFSIDHAETGHGPYASCCGNLRETLLFFVLTRDCQRVGDQESTYELQISAARRYQRKIPLLNHRRNFPPSNSDSSTWETLVASVARLVLEDLNAEQFRWIRP